MHRKLPSGLVWPEHGLAQHNDELLLGRSVAHAHRPHCQEQASGHIQLQHGHDVQGCLHRRKGSRAPEGVSMAVLTGNCLLRLPPQLSWQCAFATFLKSGIRREYGHLAGLSPHLEV